MKVKKLEKLKLNLEIKRWKQMHQTGDILKPILEKNSQIGRSSNSWGRLVTPTL